MSVPAYNVNQISLRQAITPDRLQGRMNATVRTTVWGTIPVGSLLGGLLGNNVGVVGTIYVGGAIAGLASAWIVLGPVISLRKQPNLSKVRVYRSRARLPKSLAVGPSKPIA